MMVAFIGVSAIFTIVLRPLAQSSAATGDELAAADPSQAAAHAEQIEAAIPESLGPPPLPEGPKIAILVTELGGDARSEEHTSEIQSLMRISYAVFCLTNKKNITIHTKPHTIQD